MALSRRSGRSRFTLLLLVLSSITLLTLDFRGEGNGMVDGLRDGALDALAPVRSAIGTVVSPVSNTWSGITGYDDLEEENARLRAELDELEGKEASLTDAERERAELLALHDLEFAGDLDSVTARVVAEPVSNYQLTIELDKGAEDGIVENMPVVTDGGLVGTVVQVSDTRSLVLLITDREARVGVRLANSGDVVVASGRGEGAPLRLGLVEGDTEVAVDEAVTTSGLQDSPYPPSIPVGRVSRVEQDDANLEPLIEVEPLVDLEHLEFVKVLIWPVP